MTDSRMRDEDGGWGNRCWMGQLSYRAIATLPPRQDPDATREKSLHHRDDSEKA